MKKISVFIVASVVIQLFSIVTLRAQPVTNWHTFRAAPATTLLGQGTSSPIVGSASAQATSSVLAGYFDAISLTNLGDRITFSYQVSFTDAAGFANAGDNFRFALFDLNGQTNVVNDNYDTAGVDGATDNWRGYWFGVRNGSGTGSGGSIRERISALVTGDNPFAATGGNTPTAPSLGAVGGASVTLQSSTAPTGGPVYTGVMAVEKTPSGIALAGSFGGNGATNLMAVNDNTAPFPANYAAVGYLIGALNVDQVNFQNITVAYSLSNALEIASQPTNVSVVAGQPTSFRVVVSGSGLIPTYQWRENGGDILDATNSTYTIASTSSGQNSNTYSVVVNNVFGNSVTSSNAILSVISDTNAPTVLSASSLVSNIVNVIFSEPVDPTTAQDGSSYSVTGNTISFINLIRETNVVLTLDTPISGTNISVMVQNVKDLFNNTMTATNFSGTANGFQESVSFNIANGLAYARNDKIVVEAGGTDIFNTTDQGQFVYKTFSGDFDISVRVESLLNTDANAKAGLMARVSITNDSRNVMIEATPARFILQYRTNAAANGSFAVLLPRPPTAFPNCFVRLKRDGSVFTAFSSTNAGTWDLMGSYDTSVDADGAYPNDILLGLAATSHDVNEVTEAVFSNFAPAVVTPPTLTISLSGGNVEINWSSSGFDLQSTTNLVSPIVWTTIGGSSTTNHATIPATENASFFRLSQ